MTLAKDGGAQCSWDEREWLIPRGMQEMVKQSARMASEGFNGMDDGAGPEVQNFEKRLILRKISLGQQRVSGAEGLETQVEN